MKLSLRQKRGIVLGFLGLAFALAILGMMVENSWLEFLGIGSILTGVILNFMWWRCPCCGEWLGRDKGEYCPHCGERIDFDAK